MQDLRLTVENEESIKSLRFISVNENLEVLGVSLQNDKDITSIIIQKNEAKQIISFLQNHFKL